MHKREIKLNKPIIGGACILDLSGIELQEDPSGKKILLIDDVCTSGGTIIAIAEMLEAKGSTVVCLALGLNVKLFPEPPDVLEIEQEVAHRLGRKAHGEKAQSTLPAELVEKWTQSFRKFKQEKICQA